MQLCTREEIRTATLRWPVTADRACKRWSSKGTITGSVARYRRAGEYGRPARRVDHDHAPGPHEAAHRRPIPHARGGRYRVSGHAIARHHVIRENRAEGVEPVSTGSISADRSVVRGTSRCIGETGARWGAGLSGRAPHHASPRGTRRHEASSSGLRVTGVRFEA